ncbi:MAG TPA: glycoside hydrolase family 2 TIM barrel-domain containing protein [Solirubrobacteraceae bacterium]|jgi:beta-glucuronidase|nr:glycoside hydrolase family 2 TIM barrel-domain containing protein [Solirubrobacteraceae bacterium]
MFAFRPAPLRALCMAFAVVLAAAVVLTTAGVARAQGTPYTPSPPTKGALYRDGQTDRYLLGGTWLYQADPSNVGLGQGWQNSGSTAGWTTVTVPNAYNAGQFTSASMSGYVGWYRRDFIIPSGAFPKYVKKTDEHWIVNFQSVNYSMTVWLNGRRIGSHVGAYLPFEFDLTGLRSGVNRLVVRVDNRRGPADFPPGPGGQWWNYGGLLEEVYLRAVAGADISQVQVRPVLPCPTCNATIAEQAAIRNLTGAPIAVRLHGYYGSVPLDFGHTTIGPHGTWTATASATIRHPSLWAPGHPTLYRATLNLTNGKGKSLGGYVDYSGVRSIKVTKGGRLELNGRLLNLRGFNLHTQTLAAGSAMTVPQMAKLLGYARSLGADVIRAHYPLPQAMMDMADSEGILVWSEIPVYQVKNAYLSDPSVIARALALLKNNILTNQNHPSVMTWAIGNELPTPAPNAEANYIATASALARQLDPTRPISLAVSDWPGVDCQPAYAPLDLIGFNDYFGWFDAGDGATADRQELSPFLDSFRACYPTKALMVTEFGFDGNRAGPIEEYGTYAFQADAISYHLGVFATKPWLSGAMYFALQNYVAYPGYAGGDPASNQPFNEKGVVDFQGNPKPAAATISSIYHSTTQIAP